MRNKQGLWGLLIYLVASVFTSYLILTKSPDEPQTSFLVLLLWLVLIFSSFQLVYNSFMRENKGLYYYFYQTVSPQVYILVKLIWNGGFGLLASLIGYVLIRFWLGLDVIYEERLLAGVLLGSVGITSILTLNAALAYKADGNMTLMAILSFPLLTPILMFSVELSLLAESVLGTINKPLSVLMGLDLLIILLVFYLYPLLWRE